MNNPPEYFQELTSLHQRIADLETLVATYQQKEQVLQEEYNHPYGDQKLHEHEQTEITLRNAYDELKQQMQERTAELVQANQLLQREIKYRKQIETEIVQRNGQLLTLQAAGAAISSSLDLQYILNTVTQEMTNLLGVDGCALSDWNKAKDTVYAIAGFSHSNWWNDIYLGYVFHLRNFPLTRRLLTEQRSLQLRISQEIIDPAELALMTETGIKSLLMLPMIFKEQVVGLIELVETEVERTFTHQEIALAQFLANQAGGAIENARLHQQAQQDITERKRTEATLMLERERMSSTLESIGDGVLAISAEGDVILTNPVAEDYLKILIDAEIQEILVHKESPSFITDLTAVPQTRVSSEVVLNGTTRQVFEIVKQPLKTEAQAGNQVIVIRDVTEARLAQERNQQQERLVAVGQLAAGIAHDFNNILTSVIGFAELLQLEPDLSTYALSDLQRIVQQGQRGAHLIRQILDFARQTISSKHPIDLAPLIQETVELFERTIPENINVVVDIEPGQYLLNADPTQMQQVLTNLAVNAWDAMPGGGILRFKLAYQLLSPQEQPPYPGLKPGPWIVLSVSDTGTGMSPEVQAHIFEPFFTTKSVDKGTGLGLSQVDGIIKQHEGQIFVNSQLGEGTTFILYLPPLTTQIPSTSSIREREIVHGQNQTILLVEDNLSVLKVTQKMLQRLGYQILTATNGRAALEVYKQHQEKIALVLTDSTMPVMGGMDLAQALHECNPAIKVVVITGYPLRDESKELLTRGVVNWLQKPLHFEQLAQAISQALEV